jgi:predicted nucleic acid-binding protein
MYTLDANSAAAASRLKNVQLPLPINSLGEFELVNAISLRVFHKQITAGEAQIALNLMEDDIRKGVLQQKPVSTNVLEIARRLSLKHTARLGTRSLDVLHVASALALKASTFLTFDFRQRKLALAAKLRVP